LKQQILAPHTFKREVEFARLSHIEHRIMLLARERYLSIGEELQ